ncbi:alpha/beta hydrolase [Xylanimonas cellulosilytica]|uniref:alpha/beta hydrolase n=1 Tax=Xylanimonas cellulosilytica TaxID=186189 RepID=UPI0006603795|nr:alpha/beta hydrolase [Xylanimonas cellulosilytica]
MAITWANILEWETAPLDEIAQTLFEASQGLRKAYEKGEDDLKAVQSEGEAVNAMRATTLANLASLERALTNVNGALMAIEGARDGVGTVIANIDSAMAYASAYSCVIAPDGSVRAAPHAQPTRETMEAAHTLSETVKKTLEYADQVDTDLYHALANINNDRYTDGDGANNKVVGVPDFPQPNWSPSQVATWWNSLPENHKQLLMDHRPDDIRHLDGLPAYARDRANRFALDGYFDDKGEYHKGALADAEQAVKDAQKEYDAARTLLSDEPRSGHLNSEERAAKEKLDRALEKYQDLKAIKSQTDPISRMTRGLAPAYLLDFNYDEKYQRTTAIVSAGNPDTATHVSTLVPGIGTNVRGDLGYYMDVNDRLRAQTAHAGVDPNNVATISYLGYVAPKNSFHDLGIVQAADIGYADRAAPKLAQFEEGLRASANARGHTFTNTLLTHSYGSTTGGKAAALMAPGTVDRLILAGSPGGGVQAIDEYSVPKEQVYVSAVPSGDFVEGLGFDFSYGKDPRELEGITHLSGDATGSAEYAPLAGKMTTENHMAYFHEGTRTSQDFANIIAGKKQTTDEEWDALQTAQGKVTELERKPWLKKLMEAAEKETPPPSPSDVMPGDPLQRHW